MSRLKRLQGTLLIGLGTLIAATAHSAHGQQGLASRGERSILQGLQVCHRIKDVNARLSCFDNLARQNAPPRFAGKLGFKTTPFEINEPHILRYRSEGVIFVLYLLDAKGEVVQNLHIGGGGEDSFLIDKPGIYSLQIDGSATWKIWIDPSE